MRRVLRSPWLAVVLLAVHWLVGMTASTYRCLTCDELAHLPAGFSYWKTGDFRLNPENGHLPQRWAGLPLYLLGVTFYETDTEAWRVSDVWHVGRQWMFFGSETADGLLLAGRAMIGLLSVACGAIVYAWSRRLFGPEGGVVSLVLYTTNPTVLAHGFLCTSDMAATLFFWRRPAPSGG